MKSSVAPSLPNVNPWAAVKYPCLIENTQVNQLAIATSSSHGLIIATHAGVPHPDLVTNDKTWEDAGFVPVKGPRTVTFEN